MTASEGSADAWALQARGLRKVFGDQVAVEDVSLTLGRGRVHGLLGANGAGKSTTLRMLLGLVRPDGGTIVRDGTTLTSDHPRGRHGIAGFADAPSFYPYLTASRNLELLSDWDGSTSNARVEEMLELVGLAGRAQSKVRAFSTGMRQRLGLAAAMISDPGLLIVDEPTSGLDPAGVRDVQALLVAMAASGRTVLLSSHDLDEVERVCSDVTVLRDGRVVYSGTILHLRERAGGRVWSLDTSDNDQAILVAARHGAVRVTPGRSGRLHAAGEQPAFDALTRDLATAGIALRELTRDELSFEALYFQLTGEVAPNHAATVST